mgnify:CR=1 FL=1
MASEEKPAETVSPTASSEPAQPVADTGTVEAVPERPTLPENNVFRGNDVPARDTVITGIRETEGAE